MKQAQAKDCILKEWDAYKTANRWTDPTTDQAFEFFKFLERERSQFLDFRCHGRKWDKVLVWLLETGRVRNFMPSKDRE